MICCLTVTSLASPTWNEAAFSAYHVPSAVFLNPSQRNVSDGSSGWMAWAMAGDKKHDAEIRAIDAAHVRHPLGIGDRGLCLP
jgi:hypothetical protein